MTISKGDVVELKISSELQIVLDVDDKFKRIDIRPLGAEKGRIGVPLHWVKRIVKSTEL